MSKVFRSKQRAFSDEIFVWLTSIGLSIGLAMVVFLLGLVMINGFQVFWPRPIAEATLTSGTLIGEITKSDIKDTQFYVANKDILGYAFKYVPNKDIKGISHPKDLISVERMEYGDAIGYPAAIILSSGQKILYGEPTFGKTLKLLVREAADRRAQIKDLERNKIGAINRKMEEIRLKEKAALKSGSQDKRLIEKKQTLQAEYQVLANEAGALRKEQALNSLVMRRDGREGKSIPTGQIVGYYYANQLTFWNKCVHSVSNFWIFLAGEPREANTEGGIFPAIFGTFVMTLIMSVAVTPFGVIAAIYLREYAKQGFLVRAVRIAVNNLAGVPSIVFGVFGLGFFVYFVGGSIDNIFYRDALPTPTFGTGGILWASLTLALMTVPVVIVATEEALAAVSRGVREGSLACGASKWQTIQNVVLPASAPGIMTGLILAMARGAGEVAPLMLVGVVKLAPTLPLDLAAPFIHFDRKFMHLGFHIYDLGFQSPDSEAAKPMVFATTLLLIALVVLLNMTAITIRERLRRKYAVGAF